MTVKLSTVVFHVTGIHCPKCVEALQKSAGAAPGIIRITVSPDHTDVTAEYRPEEISPAAIGRLIESVPGKKFRVLGK